MPRRQRTTEPTDVLSERSARIKRLFIELHDYSFFHNPSEIGNVDRRFIGRRAISRKLRTILTNHQTKSGSYLVTGYRGVGKSSLVAQVLSGISSGLTKSGRGSRYFRILAPLPFLALLDVFKSGWTLFFFLAFPLVVVGVALCYLIRRDPTRQDLLEPADWSGRMRERLRSAFWMEPEDYPHRRHRTLIQDFLLLSVIQIAALLVFGSYRSGVLLVHQISPLFRADEGPFDPSLLATDLSPNLAFRLTTYLLLYLILIGLTSLVQTCEKIRQSPEEIPLRDIWDKVAQRYWSKITQYLNFSHRIYIKINLGQDDLREIDILRLMARSIQTKYLQFKKFGITDVWWRLLYVLMIYLTAGIVYYHLPIYHLNLGIKTETHFYYYFPSQLSGLEGVEPVDIEEVLERAPKEASFRLSWFWDELEKKMPPETDPPDPRGVRAGASQMARLLEGPDWSTRRAVLTVTNTVDLGMFYIYRTVRDALPLPLSLLTHDRSTGNTILLQRLDLHPDFCLIPRYLDYFFLGYLFLAWLGLRALARLRPFGMVTHGVILRELDDLNDSIDAQITRDETLTASAPSKTSVLGLRRRRTKTYPIAGVREIEKRLLGILDSIDRIPRLTVRPNFIFIFDELDKIEQHKNLTLADEDEETGPGTSWTAPGSLASSYGATRERQQRILRLLSNLKHLFTTAKAKFIFIAGREMYDASLADVSDRHFFMGSIFNDVLYVPSFLSDGTDRRLTDITSMTERYLCQFLMPRSFARGDLTLRKYRQYLEETEILRSPEDAERYGPEEAERLHRMRCDKVIHELFNFVAYLTYRSNGAPKKITRLLEQYVTRAGKPKRTAEETLLVGRSSGSLYLELGYYDQYTFGLIAYLAQPLFLSLHRHRSNKDFGDKLLVSTSFLLDHLYKFHGFGFSWRNLELLPEIVDVNKAPELRGLIGQILEFLGSTHIEQIASGLHDFKFRKKITEEIAFLSKVSEAESAAFNFTLDESLPIKQYYSRKLDELLKLHPQTPSRPEETVFIHSMAFVRMILGDLHFYDEEFDHAILEYMEAVQVLQRIDPKELDPRRLALLIRNLLKLGLTFEKKKTFDAALVLYGQLTNAIVRSREVDLETIDVEERPRADGGIDLYRKSDPKGGLLPPRRGEYLGGEEEFNKALESLEFGPEIEELLFKATSFEGVRLFYQPLLAKLQIVEKSSLGGISVWDVRRAYREFRFIARLLDRKKTPLVPVEFDNKLADILFYKNGPIPEPILLDDLEPPDGNRSGKPPKTAAPTEEEPLPYCFLKKAACAQNATVRTLWKRGLRSPCAACRFTMDGLVRIFKHAVIDPKLDREGTAEPRRLIFALLEALDDPGSTGLRVSVLEELANLLSDAGDTFLSCAAPEGGARTPPLRMRDVVRQKFLQQALAVVASPTEESNGGESSDPAEPLDPARIRSLRKIFEARRDTEGAPWSSKVEEAILYFVAAARFYKLAGEYKSHSHQLTKVLYVIREVVATDRLLPEDDTAPPGKLSRRTRRSIRRELVERIIRGIYRTYQSTHRLEIEKLKALLTAEDQPPFWTYSVNLNNVSVVRELREVIVVLQEIELTACEVITGESADEPQDDKPCARRLRADQRFLSPYSLVNSMYNRIHELRYRAKENYKILERTGLKAPLDRVLDTVEKNKRAERTGESDAIEPLPMRGWDRPADSSPPLGPWTPRDRDEARDVFALPSGPVRTERVLEHLLTDSIFCLHEILRCLQTFGLSYMANHSMRAAAHKQLADWCDLYYAYLKSEHARWPDTHRRLEARLTELIGEADLISLTPAYHYERALLHYRAAIQAHTEGQAYKSIIERMYYLDDDFSDELTHFCAAMERFRINTGDVERSIARMAAKCELTRVHEPDRYFSGPSDRARGPDRATARRRPGTS